MTQPTSKPPSTEFSENPPLTVLNYLNCFKRQRSIELPTFKPLFEFHGQMALWNAFDENLQHLIDVCLSMLDVCESPTEFSPDQVQALITSYETLRQDCYDLILRQSFLPALMLCPSLRGTEPDTSRHYSDSVSKLFELCYSILTQLTQKALPRFYALKFREGKPYHVTIYHNNDYADITAMLWNYLGETLPRIKVIRMSNFNIHARSWYPLSSKICLDTHRSWLAEVIHLNWKKQSRFQQFQDELKLFDQDTQFVNANINTNDFMQATSMVQYDSLLYMTYLDLLSEVLHKTNLRQYELWLLHEAINICLCSKKSSTMLPLQDIMLILSTLTQVPDWQREIVPGCRNSCHFYFNPRLYPDIHPWKSLQTPKSYTPNFPQSLREISNASLDTILRINRLLADRFNTKEAKQRFPFLNDFWKSVYSNFEQHPRQLNEVKKVTDAFNDFFNENTAAGLLRSNLFNGLFPDAGTLKELLVPLPRQILQHFQLPRNDIISTDSANPDTCMRFTSMADPAFPLTPKGRTILKHLQELTFF